ncbi:hypothetical protein Ancab_031129 [Ancistrocladus abbreviatus]
MAELFLKQAKQYPEGRPTYQAKQYSEGRPTYPAELFQFIASKTPCHDLAWDVGTGTGQAIKPLAEIYKNVIGTDTSNKQLEYAPKLPNVRYHQTPPTMTIAELQQIVGPPSTVDLVTVAQAMHWFDLPKFYDRVKLILKKPDGVIAAWCYTGPEVNPTFDSVFDTYYNVHVGPYWQKPRELVDQRYETIEFPFEPVEGLDTTGPIEFKAAERLMSLDDFFGYLRSWSAYNTAKEKGVELLTEEVVEKFRKAWEEDGNGKKVVRFRVYLRIGRVGGCN